MVLMPRGSHGPVFRMHVLQEVLMPAAAVLLCAEYTQSHQPALQLKAAIAAVRGHVGAAKR